MNQNSKIIVAVIITAVVVGGGFYFWQQNSNPDLPNNQEVNQPTEVQQTEKTYEGNGFTFTFPKEYIADDNGLWTEEGYESHLNPPEACDTCQIPEIEVKATTSNSLDQQIINDFDLPGSTLIEMAEQTGIDYESVTLGNNDFIKITVSDIYDVTGYYTKNDDQVVGFKVYWTDKDNTDLRDIISTLKFQ